MFYSGHQRSGRPTNLQHGVYGGYYGPWGGYYNPYYFYNSPWAAYYPMLAPYAPYNPWGARLR